MPRKHCEHWYWDTNIRHHYRSCKFCYKKQYNYTGEWKDEIKLGQFIYSWTPLDQSWMPRLTIEATQAFEFQCYESWGVCFKVTILGETFGPFGDLNQADNALRKHFGDYKGWEIFDPTRSTDDSDVLDD